MTIVATKRNGPAGFRAFIVLPLVMLLTGAGVSLYLSATPSSAETAADIGAAVRELASEGKYQSKIYVTENGIVAHGAGRIEGNAPRARLLARRAALTDARRNLLEFRRDFLRETYHRDGTRGVYGRIGRHSLRAAGIDGNSYKVEIEMTLDEWLTSVSRRH
ncbi:MAG: hypothetical protein LBQ19_05990 [Synergistaceae bacterium]|nr:hypothetical protein [Synergistaceae bacterium]